MIRARALSALAPLLWLAACGPKPPPDAPPKDPPRVFVTADSADVVGTQVGLKVSVSGCTRVASVSLLEHGSFLKNITYGATPTPVTVTMGDVPWPVVGLAGRLSLSASATCDDGRANTSSAVPVTFFPVESVLERGGVQVVPDAFVVDGRSPHATFTGCAGGSLPGTTALATVDEEGTVTTLQEALPVPCYFTSNLTPRNAASAKRWLWTDDAGAFAFDAQLKVSGHADGKVNGLGVMPNGDAVTWDKGGSLRWVVHGTGQVKWDVTPAGQLAGTPQLRQGFGVYVPYLTTELATGDATFRVQALSADSGAQLAVYDLLKWSWGLGDVAYVPQAAFNADASVVYVPVPLQDGSSQVWACPTTLPGGCNSASRKWATEVLTGTAVSVVVPFNGGTRLAAVAANGTWFLDAATGAVQNKGGVALAPSEGFATLSVEKGLTGPDFYLFNGPPPDGSPDWLPRASEVVATDNPAKGELFRYARSSDTLAGAVDDAGRLWLRVGTSLARTLDLPQYRYVAPTTP